MFLNKGKQLIVLGMLVLIAGCATQLDAPVLTENKKGDALERAVINFHRAEGMGAQFAAPKSYQKARDALDNARAMIRQEPENRQAIEKMVNLFEFEVDHLLHITSEVMELRSVESIAIENVVLSAEYRLLAISDALRQPDPRRQKLFDQSVTIAEAAKQVASSSRQNSDAGNGAQLNVNRNELDKAETRIKQLELQLKSEQDRNGELTGDKKSSQKRIEFLERLVLDLTEKNTQRDETIKQLKSQLNKPKPSAE